RRRITPTSSSRSRLFPLPGGERVASEASRVRGALSFNSGTEGPSPRPSPLRREGAQEPIAVAVRGVSKRFQSRQGEVHAVDDVSLTLARGEFVSIVGPSGCGKSTLLNMIAGLMPVSAGTIEVAGRPVTGPVHDLGIVFQQHLLLAWRTILNNVLLQIEVRRLDRARYTERAKNLLGRVGLAEFADRFPDELSGGMNQRAPIVR